MKLKLIIIIILLLTLVSFTLSIFFPARNLNQDMDFHRGENALYMQRYQLAQHYFIQDLQTHPKRAATLYQLAQSYRQGIYQNLNQSIAYYQRYLALNPQSAPLDLTLIQRLYEVGMEDELKNLATTSNNVLYQAAIWQMLDAKQALTYLNAVPETLKTLEYNVIASKIYAQLQQHQQVIMHGQQVLSVSGLNKNIYYLLGQAYKNLKDLQNSQQMLQKYELIYQMDKADDSQQQLDYMLKFLQLQPDFALSDDVNSLYISLLIANKQVQQAQTQLNTINLSTLSDKNRLSLVKALSTFKADELAIMLYNATHHRELTLEEQIFYCQLFTQLKTDINYLDVCRQGVDKFPHAAEILYGYAMAMLANKDKATGLSYLSEAINYAPWMNQWIIYLANLHLLDGRVDLAKQVLNQAIESSAEIEQFKLSHALL